MVIVGAPLEVPGTVIAVILLARSQAMLRL